ncbi:hypothetical protein WG66_007943, partial [Moniliophthora roreri]
GLGSVDENFVALSSREAGNADPPHLSVGGGLGGHHYIGRTGKTKPIPCTEASTCDAAGCDLSIVLHGHPSSSSEMIGSLIRLSETIAVRKGDAFFTIKRSNDRRVAGILRLSMKHDIHAEF